MIYPASEDRQATLSIGPLFKLVNTIHKTPPKKKKKKSFTNALAPMDLHLLPHVILSLGDNLPPLWIKK